MTDFFNLAKIEGEFITVEDAIKQYEELLAVGAGKKLPVAVCYKIDELMSFLTEAIKYLNATGVPGPRQGVALMPGIHKKDGTYAEGKVTIMMVATEWEEMTDDAGNKIRRVKSIKNPVIQGNNSNGSTSADKTNGSLKGKSGDDKTVYDAGSLWP